MNKFVMEPSSKTPLIDFDLSNGTLKIKGRSIPENSIEFYKPLMEALKTYTAEVKPTTTATIQLEYFNTASSKAVLEVFKHLENIKEKGSNVTLNWNYEEGDLDMKEAGEDYQVMTTLHVTMVEVPEES